MTLQDLRAKWENNQKLTLGLPIILSGVGIVGFHAICFSERSDSYRLYRYFKMGSDWHVSVDLDNASLESAVEKFNELIEDEDEYRREMQRLIDSEHAAPASEK